MKTHIADILPFKPVLAVALVLLAPQLDAENLYQIDPVHSSVEFKIRHLGISWVKGVFRDFAGSGKFNAENPEASEIEVIVQARSIDTGNAKRDNHLRSPDFFDSEKHPKLSFKSTRVKTLGGNRYEVTGDFTLLGKALPVTVEIEISNEAPGLQPGEVRRAGETAFKIKRSDFGMAKMLGPIGDEVHISLSFEGAKTGAKLHPAEDRVKG